MSQAGKFTLITTLLLIGTSVMGLLSGLILALPLRVPVTAILSAHVCGWQRDDRGFWPSGVICTLLPAMTFASILLAIFWMLNLVTGVTGSPHEAMQLSTGALLLFWLFWLFGTAGTMLGLLIWHFGFAPDVRAQPLQSDSPAAD